ncbi:cytochrome c oxidase assembly protein subunit 15 [Cyclonatronum proteinivorum]|uniref:Cytochrome c oxidase assembly protein subunit 15 n=1 Tax=Cyclonatronum proteinivorum TaxID=1457365 RepID=A0A345UP08_9BACT|nr:COX15/CtaA family protein [Cyclonatronum proteinivorum]AXJ02210.1 cytochrome c oxidase assembly protein subunit 15 [Cyclonatronum proteinivorum]
MLKQLFPTVAVTTIVVTVLLIFIGVIVRASGAGLGCPDWPKCFGMWIPPTTAEALPPEFNPDEFNVVHTWTEYINRLFGVLVGFLIILTTIFSTGYLKERKTVFFASFLSLVLVLFQGWLGGQVVRSGLMPGMISVHMVVAMLILMTLVYAAWSAIKDRYRFTLMHNHKRSLFIASFLLLFLMFVQIVLGTQVREAIDMVDKVSIARAEWLDHVGIIDQIHRTFSWTILLVSGWIVYYVKSNNLVTNITKIAGLIFILVLTQVFIGVVLAYVGFPASFQVLHLGVSSFLIIAIQILLLASKHNR